MRRIIGIGLIIMVLLGAVVVWASPPEQANLFQLFILQARTDLEITASAFYGVDERPDEWTSNLDLESETIVVDLWYDNELLADDVFGAGSRPPEWFGATSPNAEIIARNVRHDMELSADIVFEGKVRPEGWNGASPLYRCDRTIQNTTRLLDTLYNTRPQSAFSALNYCRAVEEEISSSLLQAVFNARPDQDSQLPDLVLALRGDLERLANELLGVNERPPSWVGNVELGSPTLAADTAADLEQLADVKLGTGRRPEEWTNLVDGSVALSYRNLRFNLETLADIALGEDMRPNGWQGANPLERCSTTEQGLVFILQINYDFVIDDALSDAANFCELVTFTANSFAENPPEVDPEEQKDLRYTAESNYAFSYLDVAALQYMGIMPGGTKFRGWYRNFKESNMMFVSGEDFALYIDRRFTTMEEEVFNTLPTLEGIIPLTFCDASWCNGPAPTPTPTGSGPLLLLLQDSTPAAPPPNAGDAGGGTADKTQVSWNHIRVTYLLDRTDIGVAQVALEICAEPQQIACEPVLRVFDNLLQTDKPALSQVNGLNVYEFKYGYNNNVIVEGTTRFSNDIWISDPTIR